MDKKLLSVVGLAVLASAVASVYVAGRARASGIPAKNALVYEGVLTDSANKPLASPQSIQVRLWDREAAPEAGADVVPLCSVGPDLYELKSDGSFQVPLLDSCTTAVHSRPDVWVEVLVGGVPLSRTKLGAVPYAVESDRASVAQKADTAQIAMSLADGGASAGLVQFLVNAADLATSTICKQSSTSEGIVDCTCPAGTFAISGGGWGASGSWLRENRSMTPSSWRVTCVSGTAPSGGGAVTTKDTACAGYTLVCSRLAP